MKFNEKAKALIFDCDGTLVDSMPLHWKAWNDTFEEHGVSCPMDFLKSQAGSPIRDILIRINEKYGYDIDIDYFLEKKHQRARELVANVQPIEPVAEIARSKKGKMPMAVASGGSKENVELSLKAIGMDDFFDAVVTADDPVKGKPEPDIFLESARCMNVAPEDCHVFEDSDNGVLAAQKAGMTVTDVREYL